MSGLGLTTCDGSDSARGYFPDRDVVLGPALPPVALPGAAKRPEDQPRADHLQMPGGACRHTFVDDVSAGNVNVAVCL